MNKDTKNTNKILAKLFCPIIHKKGNMWPSLAWQKLQVEFTTGKKGWLNIRKINVIHHIDRQKKKKKIISDAAMKWDDEWKKSDKSRVYTIQVHYEILENVGEEGKKGREYRSGRGITNAHAQRNV